MVWVVFVGEKEDVIWIFTVAIAERGIDRRT